MSEGNGQPRIRAQGVWLKFPLELHRSNLTLRQTFVQTFEGLRRLVTGRPPEEREFWALRDINLTAGPGEVIGVVGRNGAGKSSLLRTLGGICTPDRGQLTVTGRVGCLLSFGVGFNTALSGRENIYLNGSILGLAEREIDERLEEIIAFAELGEQIDAPVRTYSAGMRGRLGFSIAVHIDPDVLLLDEVLSVGDSGFRAKAGSILDRFRDANKTIVIATHNMSLVEGVCTRAIWLHQGRIEAEGSPEEVVALYNAAQEASSPGAAAKAARDD